MRTCEIEDCNGKHLAKGFCKRHYLRFRKYGDPRVKKPQRRKKVHGMIDTPEYSAWINMKERCLNQNNNSYKDYGERGITVCEEWINSFVTFYEHMGDKPSSKHSLERVDVDGNYEPSNCVWATAKDQRINQRRTRLYTHNGKSQTLKDWSVEAGIPVGTLHNRVVNCGYSMADALNPEKNQNNIVKDKPNSNNTTGYVGVTYSKRDKKFSSRVTIRKKTISLGNYSTAEEAYQARLDYLDKHK